MMMMVGSCSDAASGVFISILWSRFWMGPLPFVVLFTLLEGVASVSKTDIKKNIDHIYIHIG